MKKLLELVKKGWLYALLCLVLGLLLVIWPGQTVWGVYFTAAAVLLLLAGLRIFRYFRTEAIEAHRRLTFASGGLLAVLGILMVVYRERLGAWLPELAGIGLLAVCCIRSQVSIDMKRRAFARWWWALIAAGLVLVCAVLCMAASFELNVKLILAGSALLLESAAHVLCTLWFSRTDRPAKGNRPAVQPANVTYTWTAGQDGADKADA